MKIRDERPQVPKAAPAPRKPGVKVEGKTSPVEKPGDSVTFSAQSREAQRLKKLVEEVPDVRKDRVAELRKALQDGTYSVRGDAVAEKLLTDLARDKKS